VEEKTKTTKIAVLRCDIVSEACPGVGCFKAFNERKSHFETYDENVQLIAFFTCGGCSGRRVYRLVNALKKYVWMLCTSVPACLWKTPIQNAPTLTV
jgi:predicted metal-binding protein